ncbi:GNAT family N-acetyltransferase [Anabaena lutea]|uniref:GNAT family N-acetyltransferase n=1 Tax=Anabaena lutea FACHB-196 TaxID=2692881 RepID=A0ABR8FDW6_9NOST|nr:GNAT family N-acetyltransferase [Anabaena lutea]MBD2567932.1 GNAT family N-acetyltransferase [Anabaena lutea FACHB-196]
MTIRQAKIKDAEQIAILCEQLGYSATKEQIEQRLNKIQNNSSHVIYVATVENEYVIGWAHAHISDLIIIPNQALLFGLVVDKNYRNNGIGKLLMQHIEEWATLVGCEGVILRSNIKRQEAHLFYEKIGYTNTKQSLTFYKKLTSQE